MGTDIFQHFRPDERAFLERMQDLARRVDETYTIHLTEFLNPRQVQMAKSVFGQAGLSYFLSSDWLESEYVRIILAPDYYELNTEDFEISCLELSYNAKFSQLSHSQIMGTLINQLGIKRSVFGDIRVADGRAQVMVEDQMADYFLSLTRVAKVSVTFKRIEPSAFIPMINEGKQMDILVSSMRLDKLISVVHKIPRPLANRLIESEKVKLNYATVSRSSELVQVGDMISVRGYGRFTISEDRGQSKQGKYKLGIVKASRT